MDDRLKPCPFCGVNPVKMFAADGGAKLWIGCQNDECVVMPYVTTDEVDGGYQELFGVWNRRERIGQQRTGDDF